MFVSQLHSTRDRQAVSIFIHFSICATYCTLSLNGIRTSKTVNGVTYNYLTQNGKVVRQEWNGNFMDFIYDNAGRPLCHGV